MCCENDDFVPPPVAEMLSRYRTLLRERGYDWGAEREGSTLKTLQAVLVYCEQSDSTAIRAKLRSVISRDGEEPDRLLDRTKLADLITSVLPEPLPVGLAVASRGGIKVRSPLPFAFPDGHVAYQVLIAGDSHDQLTLRRELVTVDRPKLEVAGLRVPAVEPISRGRIRLVADAPSRWTVLDERGGAWFPADALRKYDYHGRPFFHGNDLTLAVPATRLTISVTRGCEFRPVSCEVDVAADEEVLVELSPTRIYDAADRGWYGGDLHVHMNYSGDLVCTPQEAARMQEGEGLHLMNLVAANCNTDLIYDREAFEQFAGRDLPWAQNSTVARWGIEYRNDLLGHFTALNLNASPVRYQTGHIRSEQPQDWPPNSVAAMECRDLDATIAYTHPVVVPFDDHGSPTEVFEEHQAHLPCARELVVDAALGLVDSVDLTGIHNDFGTESTEYLYHRLLGCGLHLAATAGTDVMLSHSRQNLKSNPPGWSRAYANLDGLALTADGWQEAVRRGRTFATNGPWLELDVAGHGPGDTVTVDQSATVTVRACVIGLGVERLEIVGPDGPVATVDHAPDDAERMELTANVDVAEPIWLAAIARGDAHPAVLCSQTYAHTSPVWVDARGQSVARPADAEWCLDWLDRFERLVRDVGRFPERRQLDDVVEVISRARTFYHRIADLHEPS